MCASTPLAGPWYAHAYLLSADRVTLMLISQVILFELMVVNNWHVTASGYVAVTSRWAEICAYSGSPLRLLTNVSCADFISFYFLTVMIAANVSCERKLRCDRSWSTWLCAGCCR